MRLKNLLKVSCFAVLCLFVVPVMAQDKVVTGKVTDSKDGSSLPGVSIVAKGSTSGTTSDANGNFKLTVSASVKTISLSYIGYGRQEVDITGSPLDIKLVNNSTALSEVVVVGYGSQRKKDVTGAVESITAKDFNGGSVQNPLSQIDGKVAGVVITSAGGDPNATLNIQIRGQTSISGNQQPLIVVDGVILDNPNDFQQIAPGDIESYDILKDASATAIYGSRGANGVMLVTTKKGKAGKTTIDYNGFVGLDNQSKYYDLLTAAEYSTALTNLHDQQVAAGQPAVDLATYLKGGNTNWQKAITRTAFSHSNNLAVSGGAETFNFRASVNYQDQEGVVLNSDKKQLGVRFNGEAKALDNKLDVSFGMSNTSTTHNQINYDIFRDVFNSPPTYPIKNADGSYNYYSDFAEGNPVAHALQTYNPNYEYLTILNGTVNYTIIPGLIAGFTGSVNRDNYQGHFFAPVFPNETSINNASQDNINYNSYKGNFHLNYDKTFGKNTFSATAVYEYNDYLYSTFNAAGNNYLVPDLLDNQLGSGNPTQQTIGSDKTEYKIISLLGRINYNYDGRFYVTASLRRDGSDKFGVNHQWGNFPSVDVAYRIKRDLLKNVSWIDDLKIRAGYGVVGNGDGINPYTTQVIYGTQSRYFNPTNSAFQYPYAYLPTQNANPDLQWETRKGRNIGFDFSLFGNRLSGDFNYYNDKTDHMLYSNYSVPTPPFFVPTITANVGSLSNKGLEISLNGQAIKGEGLNWTVGGQITFVKTRVLNLSGTYNGIPVAASEIPVGLAQGRGLSSNPITYITPGYAPYVFYLPHYTGPDAAGNQTFDGKTLAENPNPKNYYIDPAPKFNYGITNTFTYHNLSLNFLLRGVYGQKIFNNTLLDNETITRLPGNNITKDALTNGVKDAPYSSDRWLEGASYLRLDNATLSYSFKKIAGIQSLRVYISTNNLFVITKYKGIDPEVATSLNTSIGQMPYIDASYGGFGYYPKVRSFVLGANISLK
jgi:TonB-linked SusC/RagA family outer membrane protein